MAQIGEEPRPGSDEGEREPASTALQEPSKARASRRIPHVLSKIKGVDFIQVPLAHYLDLKRQSEGGHAPSIEVAPVSPAQLAARAGSPIYLDHEVADFLYVEAGRLTIEQARTACRERFGVERTPSKSAIHRYWQRVRHGLDQHGARGKE